ncbi:hypothetical protein HDU84_005531 [Entophlyctis sp. JEL0112]|nr:hypothetical protein HDU84_005531 [Entophlyctis sp. JEL0112]
MRRLAPLCVRTVRAARAVSGSTAPCARASAAGTGPVPRSVTQSARASGGASASASASAGAGASAAASASAPAPPTAPATATASAPASASASAASSAPNSLAILGTRFPTDASTNVSPAILARIPRRLHLLQSHPLAILKRRVCNFLSAHAPFLCLDHLPPAVSLHANFDSLLIPSDHVSRAPTDTYYINATTVLRTHTSAHQSHVLSSKASDAGYLVTADVYRRDEVDTSHYPVFHQMEGIRLFPRHCTNDNTASIAGTTPAEHALFERISKSSVRVQDTTLDDPEPQQSVHTCEESDAVARHLKRTLEGLVHHLFAAHAATSSSSSSPPLQIRWIRGSFPFTQPSYEMEVMFNGKWLELLGCGVIKQQILDASGNSDKVGWAFGIGLERIAMVLYDIPDIRLFWSTDRRFLSQFEGKSDDAAFKFVPYSKYPACYKDISFWLPVDGSFHDNDMFEVVRDVAGDLAEDVALIDTFSNKKTGKTSKCFRINFRSMDRNLVNEEVDVIQDAIRDEVARRLRVELRG